MIFSDICFIYRPQQSCGQGNIFRSMCQEFCSQGGTTWAGKPPGQVHPPGQVLPPAGTPPSPAQCMLGDTGNKWAVRILLECNLVLTYIQSFISPGSSSVRNILNILTLWQSLKTIVVFCYIWSKLQCVLFRYACESISPLQQIQTWLCCVCPVMQTVVIRVRITLSAK